MITLLSFDQEENKIPYKRWNFPCGEKGIRLENPDSIDSGVNIRFDYERDDEIFELLLLTDAIYRAGLFIHKLSIPYVPYGRQDRVCNSGESLSLSVFSSLINAIKADIVEIVDPHSDVTPVLLLNVSVIEQHEVFSSTINIRTDRSYWLASPDSGATKKIYKLSQKTNPVGVLEFGKRRELSTGKIIGITLPANLTSVKTTDDIIVCDDILDNGWSFFYLAKAIREAGYNNKLVLMITHLFANQGLDVLAEYSEIYSRKGRLR